MRMKKSNWIIFIFGVVAIITGYVLTVTAHPLIGSAVVGIYLLSSIVKLAVEHKEKEKSDLQQEHISKNVFYLNKKVDEILEGVTTILTTIPEDISNHMELSIEQRQRILKASEQIQELSRVSSPLAQVETYYRLGNFFLIEKEFDKAIELYNKVISIKPTHINALYNKARALYEADRPEEALRIVSHAAKLSQDPSAVASSLINLGCTLTALGRYSEALEKYELAMELAMEIDSPSRPWLYYSAAEVAEKIGDYRKAIGYLNEFLSLAEAHSEYISKIAEVKKKIEHLERAGGV